MKETRFIDVNQKKWMEFEKTLNSETHDPDKLKDLFVELTDDLSYSRTFYERRSLSIYLNNLAQRIFYLVYKNKSGGANKLLFFWREELPSIVYECRINFIASFILFALAFLIGVVSSAQDPGFSRTILGNGYVEMTMENIESGDPMAVYKSRTESNMFLGISWNNLRVSFLTFVFGLFFGIGTIGIIFSNGVMVGTFQYFFIEKGLFWESFLSIWMHGTIEISCIIIAGAAGITMGRGILFPGTISRLQSLQLSAGKGLKIMIGIVPLIVIAAFIEGFFTRYTDVDDIVRLIFILSCLAFILGYFLYYPWRKSKSGFLYSSKNEKISPQVQRTVDYSEIKSTGEIFTDLFYIYRSIFRKYIWYALGCSLAIAAYFSFATQGIHEQLTSTNNLFLFAASIFNIFGVLFDFHEYPEFLLLNSLGFAILIYYTVRLSKSRFPITEQLSGSSSLKRQLPTIVFSLFLILLPLFVEKGWNILVFVITLPIFLIMMMSLLEEKTDIIPAISNSFNLMSSGSGFLFRFYLFILLISIVLLLILLSPVSYFLFEFFQWNLRLDRNVLYNILTFSLAFNLCMVISAILPIVILGIKLCFYSLKELNEASHLKAKINAIGKEFETP